MRYVLLAVPLLAAAMLPPAPAARAATGCPPGGAPLPPGTVQRQVGDLDGDGLPDAVFIGKLRGADGATNRVVGVSTASGARTEVEITSASPMPLRALAIDAQADGSHQVIVSDGRSARLYAFADCRLQAYVDGHYGRPFVFDLENLRDRATYQQPHQLAEGMVYVIINGELAVDGGEFTGVLAGEVLRK